MIIWWYVEPSESGSVLKRSFRAWGQFSEELVEAYREGAHSAIEHHLKPYVERIASGGVRR